MKKLSLDLKKHTLLIIIGGLLLVIGVILYNGKKTETYYYVESKMTQDEAKAIIIDKTKTIMDLYEKPNDTFSLDKKGSTTEEESDNYVKVLNYDEVIESLYTGNGIAELESTMFNKQSFVNRKDDGVYILSSIPSDNSYLNCSIVVSNILIKDETIKATVSFTRDNVDKDNINYYVYEKDIVLVKKDDSWLIDTFKYSNV